MGPLLRYWLEFSPFGVVLPGLFVGSQLGSFLTRAMFVIWLLIVLLKIGFLEVMGFVVFLSPALLVALVFLVRAGFLGAFKEFDSTETTPAHLARLGGRESASSRSKVWKRLRISEAHWCPICGTHVLHECHHCGYGSSLGDRVGVG